ncbi:hypothetical protein C7974DRAFT_408293 [Boeremia exigua]|uniref:uncharacterized protein n=1 Tax=Boeremia exigua TaxID=749465 RepID=UPI001E8DA733|nr:uncharacterized protein C7974DRAFT_408293 [Boeremia exigua]KAH6644626.1 hypothetical protein C7974DRAFT_408293 [Boeremia exigua]
MEQTDSTTIERPLRLLTYVATAITIPLNIATTILALEQRPYYWSRRRHVSAFCFAFIPLAMTVAATSVSLRYMKTNGKSPRALQFKVLDLVAAITYLAVLIPCWAVEPHKFEAVGFGVLIGYTTAPMIVNMFLHIYFTVNDLPWKTIFSSVGLKRKPTCQQCPNCQAKFVPHTTETTSKGYSLLRGEDYLDVEADPIQYRDSEDFLGEGAERAEQPEAGAVEESGKGKDMV